MKNILVVFLSWSCMVANAQLYFPPIIGNTWETKSMEELGWCEDQLPPLLQYLEESNTKGFIVLKDGRIVIEHYFGTFTADSLWYWASAGKSMTAFLIGLAAQDGLLDIQQSTSSVIGEGWTNCSFEQEQEISIFNQLTMTTGLDDTQGGLDCTDPECLNYLSAPGERWAYHNAPYTLLDSVIYYSTGQTINAYLFNKLSLSTGIYGTYLPIEYNNVLFSKTRMLARFGLLCSNQGNWNGTAIMTDLDYFNAMTHTSQELNKAYGYLWWLNGSEDYMLPGIQFQFDGPLMPDAPASTFSAMGKNGQIINVVPDQNLVVVRVGNAPTNEIFFVPNVYNNTIWQYLNPLICSTSDVDHHQDDINFRLYPNPADTELHLYAPSFSSNAQIEIIDLQGKRVSKLPFSSQINIEHLASGQYVLSIQEREISKLLFFIKK